MRLLAVVGLCSVVSWGCETHPVTPGFDVGPRPDTARFDGGPDTGVDADIDAFALDANVDADIDAFALDMGTSPGDAGDAGGTDTGADAPAQDAGRDASRDANNISMDDTGATVMPDVGMLGCAPSTHLTGMPLGSAYDWMGCGGTDARGTASNWTYNIIVTDGGIGFFHAASITAGAAGQSALGTFLLPPPSVAAPLAVVCSGTGSTVDVDGARAVTAFSFRNATTLHTSGSSAAGGLVITMGGSTVLNGDVGTHHFASATATTFGTYDATGSNMTMLVGTTALSLTLARNVDAIMVGVLQVASGTTTDVYTFNSGTATATTVTLPATVSLLGTCDGSSTGAQSLDGTITH